MQSPRVLSFRWFAEWNDELDAALTCLPAMDVCPHELYRELAITPTVAPKRVALVSQRDFPVAVVVVRSIGARWEPVTNWIVPGATFPVREGWLVDVLEQMPLPLFVSWWRQSQPPPSSDAFAQVETIPTRRLTCQGDYEKYWRKTGLFKDIRYARRRCEHLRVAINAPGAAQWTIQNWGRKWATPGSAELADTGDRLIVARYWEPRGRQVTVSLMDGDAIAAAGSVFVHRSEIVGLANYRELAYDKLGIGTRLLDAIHHWAKDAGHAQHDFGGGHSYKMGWAPEDGQRWQFVVNGQKAPVQRWSRILRQGADTIGHLFRSSR